MAGGYKRLVLGAIEKLPSMSLGDVSHQIAHWNQEWLRLPSIDHHIIRPLSGLTAA
jgi:hypothetical protein